MKRVALLLGIALVAGCGNDTEAPQEPQTFTATGTLTVPSATGPGNSCVSESGFDDVGVGTQVTIANASGKIVATGRIKSSKWAGGRGEPGSTMAGYGPCVFSFSVPDVPAGKKFYKLTISDRGTMTYSESELHREPELTLGTS